LTYFQRFWAQILFLVLSVIGVAISIYLTTAHYENAPVVCSNTGIINCERVLSSPYSYVPGTSIPISLPGLLWFLAFGVVAFLAWRVWPERKPLIIAEVVWSALGLLTALYLVFAELVHLHNICAWCTSLHIIILVMLLISVYQLLQWNAREYDEYDEEEETVGAKPLSVNSNKD
jgi:uncharacterized membrane protein